MTIITFYFTTELSLEYKPAYSLFGAVIGMVIVVILTKNN